MQAGDSRVCQTAPQLSSFYLQTQCLFPMLCRVHFTREGTLLHVAQAGDSQRIVLLFPVTSRAVLLAASSQTGRESIFDRIACGSRGVRRAIEASCISGCGMHGDDATNPCQCAERRGRLPHQTGLRPRYLRVGRGGDAGNRFGDAGW